MVSCLALVQIYATLTTFASSCVVARWSTCAYRFQHLTIIGSGQFRKACVLESGDDFTHGGDDLTRGQHGAISMYIFNIGDDFTHAGAT